ncbi:hypothetical protein D1867_12190 [Acidianus infernus]|uniref:Uncharacterized protein n=1 Tax=Acidianus infernus TaxID=12915 RepID=A0A6A9QKZ5_ACIIN|nr:hypothetical protein [Acidianus infernus]MUM65970.1 hypothetical protein [Acidianus infernus]
MSQNIDELFMNALEAYHPFIGSENWKYSDVLTAFIHSVSAAYSAYKLSLVLGNDDDFAEKAFFIGLFHDFYQKFGKKVEDLREVVKMFVDDKEVLDGINYNLAENPSLNPKFGKIVWFADMMQSSNMSFLDLFNLVKKVDPSLNAYFFTVSLPQIGTRSAIMKKVVEKVEEMTDNSLIVLTKDGVVVITNKDIELPIRVNWDELKIPRDGGEWAEIEKRDKELINDFFGNGKPSANFKGFFYNVEVDDIEHKEGGERCFLCGIESPKLYVPQAYGYALYSKASNEKWSPKVEPLSNLHYKFDKKYGICFWCAYDALYLSKHSFAASRGQTKYFLVGYFTRPTPKEVAENFSILLGINVDFKTVGNVRLDEIENDLYSWRDFVHDVIPNMAGDRMETILDYSSAMILRDFGSIYREGKRSYLLREQPIKGFVELIPSLSALLLISSFYPVKVTPHPDQVIERRILTFGKPFPIIDYDPAMEDKLPPFSLSLLFSSRLLEEKDRFDLMDFDFSLTTTLLSSVNPRIAEAIKGFKSKPKVYYNG